MDADTFFAQDGVLSEAISDYQHRESQVAMSRAIFKAYRQDSVLLVEAGTGIGKSWAYLLPAIQWAIQKGERTIISTHTIALQEQLMAKDIPFLIKLLGAEIEVALLKGIKNYVCLKRYEQFIRSEQLMKSHKDEVIDTLESWIDTSPCGSRSDLPVLVPSSIWPQIQGETESCDHSHCHHFKTCKYFEARRKASDAGIIVVNHFLLMSDLARQGKGGDEERPSTIPGSYRLIVDEAHHIESVAQECFSYRVDPLVFYRLMSRLMEGKNSPIIKLIHYFNSGKGGLSDRDKSSLATLLDIEMPAKKQVLMDECAAFFHDMDRYFSSDKTGKNLRLKMHPGIIKDSYFQNEIIPKAYAFKEKLYAFIDSLEEIIDELNRIQKKNPDNTLGSPLSELSGTKSSLQDLASGFDRFFSAPDAKRVDWVEYEKGEESLPILVSSDLDIHENLKTHLFDKFASVKLCSATLTTSGGFEYVKNRLGLKNVETDEKTYISPFDYLENVLLAIPTDQPESSSSNYYTQLADTIYQALIISQGRAFVLFTSYQALEQTYTLLVDRLEQGKFTILKQGEGSRTKLIEQFKLASKGVLFGTDSFWEGVDIAGEALQLVIITKLPFKVPTDPYVEALSERLISLGQNPFMDYHIPQAILKFKQGFGRLIRKEDDWGTILCLDPRIVTKRYGSHFVESLPKTKQVFGPLADVLKEMKKFTQSRMERSGIEPLTSTMPLLRSPS